MVGVTGEQVELEASVVFPSPPTPLPEAGRGELKTNPATRLSDAGRGELKTKTTTGVVHVSLGTNVGGMEKLLVEFAKYADREQFELSFASLEARGKLATDIEQQKWPVYAFEKKPGLRIGLVHQLAKRLRSLHPTVVHTHNTAGFVYGVLAAKLARIPKLIHTRHGQRFNASRRETWLFRVLSKLVDRVVSVSEDGRQLTISEGVSPDRAITIRNGVDLQRFPHIAPVQNGSNENRAAILVARLSPEKDIATLIHAVKHLLSASEEMRTGIILDVVGDGAERCKLEALSDSLGLARSIRFLGERDDIPALLGKASMFVLPSLTEGISLTLLEAMARGLPVVATRVGGTPEVVVHESTGLLVPAQDPVALAEAMARIHQQPVLAKEMGILGRKRVEQEFSVQRMVQEYERLYLDVLRDSGGSLA